MSCFQGAVALVPLFAACLLGCSSAGAAANADGGAEFIAYQSDFQAFHSWTSFTFEGAAIPDSPHATAGVRTEYINQLPPKGATRFPVGTIIVKEFVATGQTFAMVKRGGGYNSEGAVDWEWYELVDNASSVTIRWNGAVAPPGDVYANSPVTCNDCHSAGAANDYVQSQALSLARLATGLPFDGGVPDDAAGSVQDAQAPQDAAQ